MDCYEGGLEPLEDMSTWILLLRGINVGGRHSLPMKELVRDLESLGLENVSTYIQSGNVVFESSGEVPPSLSEDIALLIEERHGFRPQIFLMSADRLERAVRSNPFPEGDAEPRSLHLFFLDTVPEAPDMESIKAAQSPTERFRLADDVFYLHAPDGVGRSKLAGNVERWLGVAVTARNWRTAMKLLEMSGRLGE